MITRYDEAKRALADPRLIKAIGGAWPAEGGAPTNVQVATNQHMLSLDPPDHTRLRRLVSSVFTARRIADLRPTTATPSGPGRTSSWPAPTRRAPG